MDVTVPATLECDEKGRALSNPVIACDYILDTQTIEYDCDSIATGVQTLMSDSDKEDGQPYNLLGRKVSAETRGIVIINGKKILNKDFEQRP